MNPICYNNGTCALNNDKIIHQDIQEDSEIECKKNDFPLWIDHAQHHPESIVWDDDDPDESLEESIASFYESETLREPHTLTIGLQEYANIMLQVELPIQLLSLGFSTVITRAVLEQAAEGPMQEPMTYFDCFAYVIETIAEYDSETQPIQHIIPETDDTNDEWSDTFSWPIVEMAEFEFGLGNEPCDVSFDCVGVIVDLPCVEAQAIVKLRRLLSTFLFKELGTVKTVTIPIDRENGCAKGCAFVEFTDHLEAHKAMTVLDGLDWAIDLREIRARMFRDYDGFISQQDTNVEDKNLRVGDNQLEQVENQDEEELTLQPLAAVDDNPNEQMNKHILRNQLIQAKFENHQLKEKVRRLEDLSIKHWNTYQVLEKQLSTCREKELEAFNRSETLRQMHQYVEQDTMQLKVNLSLSEGRVAHLRNRLQKVLGHDLEPLSVQELIDLEESLEHALLRIRKATVEKREVERQLCSPSSTQETMLCVVCLSKDKSIVCLPCRHFCLCFSCSEHDQMSKCPVCREVIDEKISVFA